MDRCWKNCDAFDRKIYTAVRNMNVKVTFGELRRN